MLTFEQIKELIQLVSDRGLGRFKLERSGFVVEIDATAAEATSPVPPQAGSPIYVHSAAPSPAPASGGPATQPASPAAGREAAAPPSPASARADAEPEGEGDHVLTSPIVGTFYRAPAPDADPFVQEGDRVKEGQVLCIVEAMKLMNEIEADVSGTIVRILPKNAQPVEYGEALFAIQTD